MTLFSLIGGMPLQTRVISSLNGRSIVGLFPTGSAGAYRENVPDFALSAGCRYADNVTIASRFSAKARDVATGRTAVELLERWACDRSDDLAEAPLLRTKAAKSLAQSQRRSMCCSMRSGGLTPTEVDDMLAILGQLKEQRGLTILMIEHVMRALMRISDRIQYCTTANASRSVRRQVVDDERVRASIWASCRRRY
jgi:branched-chain amino acid transport system ATP-binding protein